VIIIDYMGKKDRKVNVNFMIITYAHFTAQVAMN